MIKLDLSPKSLTFDSDPEIYAESDRRLIVLVPSREDYRAAARRIWELAQATGAHVLLLGLCRDAGDEPMLRRELVTLSVLIQDTRVHVDIKIEIGMNWLKPVKSSYRDGDMIVCQSGQRSGLLQRPLSQILESNLDAPIYILSGLTPVDRSRSNCLFTLIGWAGVSFIIVCAFLLQIQIVSIATAWAQTTLLILTVIVEIWLIVAWNSRFG